MVDPARKFKCTTATSLFYIMTYTPRQAKVNSIKNMKSSFFSLAKIDLQLRFSTKVTYGFMQQTKKEIIRI